jgi:hypothetical protein
MSPNSLHIAILNQLGERKKSPPDSCSQLVHDVRGWFVILPSWSEHAGIA